MVEQMESILHQKLTTAFHPTILKIENQSYLHEGHAGSPGSGNSHFRVYIVSTVFEGLSRLQRHQQVYAALKDELKTTIHALSIIAKTPEEMM